MSVAYGSRGSDVVAVQTALVGHGYSVGPAGLDGIFGPDTLAAVQQFQTDHGLTSDGIVGEQTAEALGIILSDDTGSNAPAAQPAPGSSQPDAQKSNSPIVPLALGAGALWWLKPWKWF